MVLAESALAGPQEALEAERAAEAERSLLSRASSRGSKSRGSSRAVTPALDATSLERRELAASAAAELAAESAPEPVGMVSHGFPAFARPLACFMAALADAAVSSCLQDVVFPDPEADPWPEQDGNDDGGW